MAGTRAAIRYAKAILDLAVSKNAADAVNNDMLDISKSIENSPELKDTLNNAVISTEAKKDILLKIFPNANPIFTSLLDVLVSNKRMPLLNDVALNYVTLYEQSQGIEVAQVTTAVPLTEALESKILEKVKTLTTSANVKIESIVDEAILGGFILRVGDKQFNASIANKLNNLKREFSIN